MLKGHHDCPSLHDPTEPSPAVTEWTQAQPLHHHHASLQVLDAEGGRALLVWITDLLPDSMAPEARAHIERGAVVMQRALQADGCYGVVLG